MKDWYRILGVSRQASESELKAAYRKLAKQYHPDAHPGDQECERRFRDISEAYSILSDPEKRRKYDAELGDKKDGKERKNTAGDRTGTEAGQVDFENLYRNFESFFGFHPDTKEIVNEKKLNPDRNTGNPLDTTAVFEKFMGIKR
ncbi:MAG: J domain-containing protein [Lachnospiraceae bacterium]|mgnify:FL=1|jgi:curved DNA-binding protein|uniref:J domain-containing protein n=1 Tax=Candidatus Merdisoma sp. JLR.KK011 TaxID=3114299 RepID=UPI002FF06E47|nr:J domain-containing protein [Lachnospiraceae bacterium]